MCVNILQNGGKVSDELFRQAFAKYGSPWRVADQASVEAAAVQLLRNFFDWAISTQRNAIGPNGPIYCQLLDNASFNALATEHHRHEFVTLFAGAANRIYVTYFGFMSDPDCLPAVGDPSRERLSTDAIDNIRRGGVYVAHDQLPKDRRRLEAARELSLLTCLFILLHEVGHIVRGHPTFLRKKHGVAAYEELPAVPIAGEAANIRLAFEWEADEYAAITSYQVARILLSNAKAFPNLQAVDANIVWSIATSMTFILISQVAGGMATVSPTHAPPLYRYVWSMLSVEDSRQCRPFSPQGDAFRNGFSELADWFKRNQVLSKDSQQHVTLTDYADTHLDGLQKQYDEVKRALASESGLLATIVRERKKASDEWRAKNQPE